MEISRDTASRAPVVDTMVTDGETAAIEAAAEMVMQPQCKKEKRKRETSRLSKNRGTGSDRNNKRR